MLYNPVYEMERIQSIINDLFGPIREENVRSKLLELTNVYDNGRSLMLQFLAPRVNLSDVSVDYSNGRLSVSIKRAIDAIEDKDHKLVRREKSDIDFTRSYTIYDETDTDKIDAKLMNGMLMVNIP